MDAKPAATLQTAEKAINRRNILSGGGAALSAAGALALAGASTPAMAQAARGNAANDANLLNAARALEFEGIAAYQIALDSGLLPPNAVGFATLYQSHHQQHNEELEKAIKRLGGEPVGPKTTAQYVKQLEADKLKSFEDILRLALRLESGAASAYLGLIEPLKSTDLHALVARLAADEAAHAATFMIDLASPISEKVPLF